MSIVGYSVIFIDRSLRDTPNKRGTVIDKYSWPIYDAKSNCDHYLIEDEDGKIYNVDPDDLTDVVNHGNT